MPTQNTVVFQLREDTQKFFIDAASLDLQLEDFGGFWGLAVRITDPNGDIAYESPDYDLVVPGYLYRSNASKSGVVDMPVDVANRGIDGSWTFAVKICSQDQVTPVVEPFSDTVDMQFLHPEAAIEQIVDVDSSSLTSIDTTVYTQNSIMPSITREHAVRYPLPVNLPPVVVSTQQNIVSPIYDGIFRTDINSLAVYAFGPRFSSRTLVSGFRTVEVIYISLDGIQQKLFDLNARFVAQAAVNNVGAKIVFDKLTRCTQLITLFQQAQRAGRDDLQQQYYNALVAILGSADVATTVYG